MPKYVEKYTKNEILVELDVLKNFWLKVKLQHDQNNSLTNQQAMDYLSGLKDVWVQRILPFQNTEDFQAKELFEKSKRIYFKMLIFLEKYIDPVTVEEVNEIQDSLKSIIDKLLVSRKKQIQESDESKSELKKYLKFVIDRLAIASRAKNPVIDHKVKEVDKKLNLIITNNHLYA
jgi:hypothetical protein